MLSSIKPSDMKNANKHKTVVRLLFADLQVTTYKGGRVRVPNPE